MATRVKTTKRKRYQDRDDIILVFTLQDKSGNIHNSSLKSGFLLR